MPARRAGVELVADALERRDAAVALWAVVEKQWIARSKRLDYHVEALGVILQDVHTEGGKWRIKLFLSFMVGNGQWPWLAGEEVKGFGSKQASVSKPQPAVKEASRRRSRRFTSRLPSSIWNRGDVNLLRGRPASALARH